MNKRYLKQMLTYFSRVYHLGEKIKGLKDGRINPQIETSTISFIVLFTFICRLKSFNRLEHWLEKGRFKNLFPKGTRLPHIDAVRRSLSSFDINGLNGMHDHIIKTIFNLNSASSKQIKNSISMNVKKRVFCYKFCTLITAYLH